jgi:hypothetical protein
VAFRWLTTAALVFASALVLGVTNAEPNVPAPVGDASSGRVGISTNTVWLSPAEGYVYLRRMRDAGITWVREEFAWNAIEPRQGHFDWRRTDALMRSAAELGVNVLALALGSPSWASGHADSDKYPPTRPADYAHFVRALALRYGPGGTFWSTTPRLPDQPLTAIEIWNEPWLGAFWGPIPDPAAYASLVRAAASAIKAVRPEIDVLASGDIFQLDADGSLGADWLQPLLAADPSLWSSGLVDAWSVHPYCQRLDPWNRSAPMKLRFDRVELTRSLTVAANAPLPFWITELGWTTSPAKSHAVSEELQARYEYEALRRATDAWGSFVARSFIYTFNAPSRAQDYNLLRPDGSAKPAWAAVKRFIASER